MNFSRGRCKKVICFAIISFVYTLTFGDNWRHFGNKNKKNGILFCISLNLHYLCSPLDFNYKQQIDKNNGKRQSDFRVD
jgi:hypothetical protein